MKKITSHEFNEFCEQNDLKIIKYGRPLQPKVFEKNNIITKLFYAKQKWFSKNTLKPQALRFSENVKLLRQRGFLVPEIIAIKYCPNLKIHLIDYKKIAGQDVRSLGNLEKWEVLDQVADLLADLHEKGIYFRSIHLENLLYRKDQSFALIDITDVRFSRKPISIYKRFRNLKHLFTMHEDKTIWAKYGILRFLTRYYQTAKLNKLSHYLLQSFMQRYLISK